MSWESGSVRGWKVNLHCRVCNWKCFCVHERVCVWSRQLDSCSVTGHPAAAEKLLVASAQLLPVFHKYWRRERCPNTCSVPFADSVYMCTCALGGVTEWMYVNCGAQFICVCASKWGYTYYLCPCVRVFCSKQMFFFVLFFQGVYTNWIRWTPAGAASLSKVDNIRCMLWPIAHMLTHTHACPHTHVHTHTDRRR